MLYCIMRPYDGGILAILKGPRGMAINQIIEDFLSNFDTAKLGPVGFPCRDDFTSHSQWLEKCNQAEKEWQHKRSQAIAEFSKKYQGLTLQQMLIDYLQKEHGLKLKPFITC